MARRRSLPLHLRMEARTAAFMLSTVQAEGDPSTYTGLQSWIGDLVDVTVCRSFEETFGLTITEFLRRVRARLSRGRRKKYFPPDDQLAVSAAVLADQQFAALGGQQSAKPAGRATSRRRQVRLKPKRRSTL
jgi:hypothetical protein